MIFTSDSSGNITARQDVSIMVANTDERDKLTGIDPGTIAFTAGYENMWQLKTDGTWKTIVSA